nr:MAG TPA: hypothetical protein [Bacteriophage sp.]
MARCLLYPLFMTLLRVVQNLKMQISLYAIQARKH